jgi:hypothetical protein
MIAYTQSTVTHAHTQYGHTRTYGRSRSTQALDRMCTQPMGVVVYVQEHPRGREQRYRTRSRRLSRDGFGRWSPAIWSSTTLSPSLRILSITHKPKHAPSPSQRRWHASWQCTLGAESAHRPQRDRVHRVEGPLRVVETPGGRGDAAPLLLPLLSALPLPLLHPSPHWGL